MTETPAKKAAAKAPATPNVTPETPNFTPDVEAAAERIKKTSERVLALSKENGLIWLEAYEKMLDGVLKLEEDTAKDLSSDWVEKFVSTQADFIRATSQAYLGAFKDRLKYSRCPSTAPDVRRSGRLRKTPPGKRAMPEWS